MKNTKTLAIVPKKTHYVFLIFIILIFLLFLFLSFVILNFSQKTNRSPQYFFHTFSNALNANLNTPQKSFNLLLLGLDKRDDWLEKTETTDTIIYMSYNYNSNKINLISLPRDLWYYPLATKINNIYPLATNDLSTNFDLIKSHFSQLLDQPVDHILVIETKNLEDLVKLLGGIDLYLENGFKDYQYPNPEYINNPSPNVPIYITVEYPSGWNHLDETNLAPFVRSRKSAQTAAEGGTDLGRIKRQQLLIEAMFRKIVENKYLFSINNLSSLYNFYHQEINSTVSDQDILEILALNYKQIKKISISKFDIPIGLTINDGVIYHPNYFISNQWVFLPTDNDYKKLQIFIQSSLND